MQKYDVTIAGGGIAGLATAEMFARSGYKTLLLEKGSKLCPETSGLHHEWFHFGSLYSIFPNKQYLRTLVGGIDDLLQYYRDFSGMNLRIDGQGKLIKIASPSAWFREDNLEYVVASTSSSDFSLSQADFKSLPRTVAMRLVWDLAIRRFICRHNRFHKYDWRRGFASHYIPQAGWFDFSDRYCQTFDGAQTSLDPNCHIAMPSYDCPMQAHNIVSELTRALLARGGEIRTGATFQTFKKRAVGVEIVTDAGPAILSQKLILATGAALQRHSGGKLKIKTVVSPLLVVTPDVCSRNLVRLSPFIEQTINHIRHTVNDVGYSLIGGGYFAPMDDDGAISAAGDQLFARARQVFPGMRNAEFVSLYFGAKSEMVSSVGKRNYLYRVEKIDDDVFGVVPGKFSLGFSLAFSTFREVTGEFPKTFTDFDSGLDVSEFVELTKHKNLVRGYLNFQSQARANEKSMDIAA